MEVFIDKIYLFFYFLFIWFFKFLKLLLKINVNDNIIGGSWDWGDFWVKGNNLCNDLIL